MMNGKMVLGVAGVVVVAGCSSGAHPAASHPVTAPTVPTTASSPAPSASPVLWTKAQAGREYLAMVAAPNRAVTVVNKLLDSTGNDPALSTLTGDCGKAASALHTFTSKVAAGAWPQDVQQVITADVAETSKVYVAFKGCAVAGSLPDALASLNTIDASASGASEAVRAALGLPGVGS